jgi:hypothetical protein
VKRADTGPSAAGRRPVFRRTPRRSRTLAGAGLAVVLAAVTAGCSTQSPATVTTPYAPSDGVNVDLSDQVKLRNLLIVAEEKGGQGALVGAVVNDGDRSVTVELTADLGEATQPYLMRVTVPANSQVLVAPGQEQELVVKDLPAAPGEVLGMTAASPSTGADEFQVPVLPPEGQYESLTVAPTTEPPTPTDTPGSTDPAGGTGTGQSGDEPTGEPTDEATSTP